MELTPRRVLLIGCAISCFTIPQYILYQPGSDAEAQQRQRGDDAVGYWGPPDGEFNWCEEDYRLSPYIAEPVNTASGSLYLGIWVAGEGLQRGPVFRPSFSSRLVLVFAGMIGVGTVLFHASLRYTPQLMDELPIFYLLLHTAVELYYRDRPTVPAHAAAAAASGALAISAGLFSTVHGSIAHDAWRGVMMVPFCGGFLYTFYGTSAAMGEMEAAMLAPGGAATAADAAAARKETRALFGHATGLFILGLVCWIADNAQCAQLRRLPLFPHLHTIWHATSALGMYELWVLREVQRIALGRHGTCDCGGVEGGVPVPSLGWW